IPGAGGQAGLLTFILGATAGMREEEVELIRYLALGVLILVVVLFKEFKLIAFDPAFARVQGWPTLALDFLMMVLIAVAVVIGLPAVGVVMMAALLILPAAAARFWAGALGGGVGVSGVVGMARGRHGAWS